jgi:O-antigen/teichoic acid export membrane protein
LWVLFQNIGVRFVSFFSQIVLAWILRPSDFGDISLAYSVSYIIGGVISFGIDDVLQSRPKALHYWASYATGFCLTVGVAGFFATAICALVASEVYHSPSVFNLIMIIALSLPFSALSTVPNVFFLSNFKFRFLFTYGTVEYLTLQLLTILLALAHWGAYSFAIPVPIAGLVKTVIFWNLSPFRFRLKMRLLFFVRLFRKGALAFGSRLAVVVRDNASYIVLGLWTANDVVGYYFFAFRMAAIPIYSLTTSLTSVLFPALARLQNDVPRQRSATLSASRTIFLLIVPLSFLAAATAYPLLHFLFGEKWLPSVPILRILFIGLVFDVPASVIGAMLDANGKFREQFLWAITSLPFFLLFIILGGKNYGSHGVAIGVASGFFIFAPIYSYYALRSVGGRVKDVVDIYLPPVVCGAISSLSGASLPLLWPDYFTNDIVWLLLVSVWTLALYLILIRLIAPTAIKEGVLRARAVLSGL